MTFNLNLFDALKKKFCVDQKKILAGAPGFSGNAFFACNLRYCRLNWNTWAYIHVCVCEYFFGFFVEESSKQKKDEETNVTKKSMSLSLHNVSSSAIKKKWRIYLMSLLPKRCTHTMHAPWAFFFSFQRKVSRGEYFGGKKNCEMCSKSCCRLEPGIWTEELQPQWYSQSSGKFGTRSIVFISLSLSLSLSLKFGELLQ